MLNFLTLIDRVDEIKKLFITEYISFVKPARRPPIQTPNRTIHKNVEYIAWRAEIEAELDGLPQTDTINDIRKLFRKMDNGIREDVTFELLSAKLKALKNHLPDKKFDIVQDNEARYQEIDLNKHILHALINVQKTKLYHGKSEDDINDGVRNALDMVYELKDQTRQGESESGNHSGELDILLCRDALPWAVVEALKLASLDKENLEKHVDKSLIKYDFVGCKNTYILIYATAANFVDLWSRIVEYMGGYEYPYEVINEIREMDTDYAESKLAYVDLNRNDVLVRLHIFAINMR